MGRCLFRAAGQEHTPFVRCRKGTIQRGRMPMVVGVVAGVALVAVLVLIGLFKLMWRVAEPNEALIISGSTHKTEGLGEGMGFRIVTGRGTLVLPGVQAVR